jgi:hypothetical protein
MTHPALHALVVATGGAESFPSPTLFVIVYAVAWVGLLVWLAWLATRQHSVNRSISEMGDELQARLERAEQQLGRKRD